MTHRNKSHPATGPPVVRSAPPRGIAVRSSDDAERALLRLVQPAYRVGEPRVLGEELREVAHRELLRDVSE